MIHRILKRSLSRCAWLVAVLSLLVLPVQASVTQASLGSVSSGSATISAPLRIGGYYNAQDPSPLDVDLYPRVAYDAVTGRYLSVWMSPRNAGSTSDGFDIYGIFLDLQGQPTGSEFRISDDNTAARSSFPTVAAGEGEFAVAWTVRGTACRVAVQKVTNAAVKTDQILLSGIGHRHSPALVYNPASHRYALAYVEGDDYLPPTLFGANTADCGNNPNSTSSVKAVDFTFTGDVPETGTPVPLSAAAGSFRPSLAYSTGLDQYLAVWEDRSKAAGQPYRFDVYAQRLDGQLTLLNANFDLTSGGDYTNFDTSATWTPRPAITAGSSQYFATWFHRSPEPTAVVWSVMGSRIPPIGITPTAPMTVTQITFAQDHTGSSPGGYLSIGYSWELNEYLVGYSSYMESLWGYRSFVLAQRVNRDGQLLKLDGSVQSQPGIGYILDHENEDQVAPGMAVQPLQAPGTTGYLLVYSKHMVNHNAEDIDIWSVRLQEAARTVLIPFVIR